MPSEVHRMSNLGRALYLAFFVGYLVGFSPVASAAESPAVISARIEALSGLSTQNISEIFVVERDANIVIIAADINIPIVVDPKAGYLLVKNASTGVWTRVLIDAAEWESLFQPYFAASGIEMLSQPYSAALSSTADQEATELAAVATVTGSLTANLIFNGGSVPESRIIFIHTDLLGSPVSESNEAGEIE